MAHGPQLGTAAAPARRLRRLDEVVALLERQAPYTPLGQPHQHTYVAAATMLWSGLFADHETSGPRPSGGWTTSPEARCYWPDGPERPPHVHHGEMANTAPIGDNHGMFHQVGPVGPFHRGTVRVTPLAELAPVRDGSGDWVVVDHGDLCWHAPLSTFRVSVLWKADVYRDAGEAAARKRLSLSLDEVEARFNDDLARRGASVRSRSTASTTRR